MAEALIAPPPGFVLQGAMPPPPPGFVVVGDVPVERRATRRLASGVWESMQAGWQGSIPGLVDRGKMPEIVLDPHHNKWYESLAGSASQLFHEVPEMLLGAIGGGMAGTAVAGPVGTVVGGGAGAFAVPTAIRQSLIEAYSKGTVTSTSDFLSRTGIVIKETGKSAVVGAVSAGAGMVAARTAGTFLAPKIGETITAGTAALGIGAAETVGMATGLIVTPAALEGRLPEAHEITNVALLIGGLKGATAVAGKIANIYAKTGVTPEQVLVDARRDPTIAADLVKLETETTKFADQMRVKDEKEQQVKQQLVGKTFEEIDTAYGEAVALNLRVETEAVGKFLGNEAKVTFEGLSTRRAKDRWLDDHATENMQDWINARQLPEDTIRDIRGAVNDFDMESAYALGRSISVNSRNIDKPGFMLSPEGFTFRNALNYAKEQGWSLDEVLGGMRSRAGEWAGRDAKELFTRLFSEQSRKPGKVELPLQSEGTVKPDLFSEQSRKPGKVELPLQSEGTVKPDDIPVAYKALAEAQMLRDALPEPVKVQEIISNPRGTITEGKEPNHINYRFTESAEDVQALRAKIAETMKAEIEAERGKESWGKTQEKAQAIINDRLAGMTDAQKETMSRMQFEDLAAQSMAVEALAQRAAYDARAAATEIALKGNEATPADAARLAAAIEQSALLHAIDQGNGAEIARALNSRKAAKQRGELATSMEDALAQYGKDPHFLARIVLGLHTSAEMTNFAKNARKATKWEMAHEAFKAWIIGPVSQIWNVVGNSTMIIASDIVHATAALKPGGTVKVAEIAPRLIGHFQGIYEGLALAGKFIELNLKEADINHPYESIMRPLRKLDEQTPVKMEQHRKAIPGDFGVLVRGGSFPWLGVADGAARLIIDRAETNGWAARKAVEDGFSPFTRQFYDRMGSNIKNMPENVRAEIDATVTRGVLQDKLGPWGQGLQKTITDSKIGPFFIPFMQTMSNALKEMARLTPLAAPFVSKWQADIKAGGAARDRAQAELVVGGALMVSGVIMASQGNMTGYGPVDRAKRRVWMDAGNQPYSIRFGEGGNWYDISRIQPIGTMLGLSADMYEIRDKMTPEEKDKIPKMVQVSFAQAVSNQIWLKGLVDLMRGVSEADRYAEKIGQNLASAMVPFSGWLGQTASVLDPYMREVNSIMDAIRNRIPIVREGLPAKRDTFGEKVKNPGELSPIKIKEPSEDLVLTEAARLKVGVAPTPKAITLPSFHDRKLGEVKLTPEQRDMFGETSGKLAYSILEPIVNSESWMSRPDMDKKRIYEIVFEKARSVAKLKVLPPEQMKAEMTRIVGEIRKRRTP